MDFVTFVSPFPLKTLVPVSVTTCLLLRLLLETSSKEKLELEKGLRFSGDNFKVYGDLL